jgi:hypothetical protein
MQGAWLVQEHEHWTSRVSHDESEYRFRAAAAATTEAAAVALVLDRFPGACDALYASLNIGLPRPSKQSVVMMDDVGYVRVDEEPIRTIRFNARVQEGEAVVFLEITRVLGDAAFFRELRRGRTLRLKLGTARTTYYIAFPLDGYSAATGRTLELCRANEPRARALAPPSRPKPRGTEDRDYFGD